MLPLHTGQMSLAFVSATVVAVVALRMRALTLSGSASALVMGTIIFGLGGWPGAWPLLTFFTTSSVLSRWRRRSKETLGFEKTGRRDAAQVWANGGVAVFCVPLPLLPLGVSAADAHVMFLAALAAANADTWATEIGAAVGGTPFLITTGRRVARGSSGAVSVAGLVAALAGAALLGAFSGSGRGFLLVTLAGWAGALFDSLLGATVQAQWHDAEGRWTEVAVPRTPERGLRGMNNDLVNGLSTLFAAGLTFGFLRI